MRIGGLFSNGVMASNTQAPATKISVSSPGPRPGKDELLHLYERMVLLRQFEEAAGAHYKKGEMPGFIHLYVGQEAVAVGICAALNDQDWITSTHRGHGHALAKGMSPHALMAELYAKATGCCGGRGGSMHLYDPAHGVFGTNGIVGGGIPHAVGVGIGARIRGASDIAAAFFGDGGTSHGAFHESLNFAGVQKAGVLFVCENNLYATATPLVSATLNPDIASKAAAYGVTGAAVDGNDVLAVREVALAAAGRARNGEGPTLIEAKTYRTVGHNEGEPLTGTYRTQEEFDLWKARCPILRFRKKLIEELKVCEASELDAIDSRMEATIKDVIEFARNSPEPDPATYSLHVVSEPINPEIPAGDPAAVTQVQGWLEAVRDGIAEEFRCNPNTIYFGEGTGERGGSFAHTKGLWKEFGGNRIIDTPICELGFTGAAIGASATGCRAIADLMFVDFLFETGGQIPLQVSKLRYMSNGQLSAPVVVRAPCGAIKSAGPHHSGTYHAMWAHLPGVLVAMPSNPADAKGLMKTALRGDNPVLFLEPKALFSSKGEVPVGEHFVPFGVARIVRPGTTLTLVAVGRMVPLATEAAKELDKEGISCEVIDPRTIVPLDVATIMASLKKTGRLLIVDEGYAMCGLGAEIAAAAGELAFDELDAPVARLQMEPVSHAFSPKLESMVLPDVQKIIARARDVMKGIAPAPRRIGGSDAPSVASPLPPPPSVPAVPVAAPAAPVVPPAAVAAPQNSALLPGEPITMPHGDLTVSEGKVVRWLKEIGEAVNAGEVVAEIETDKALIEIEAPKAGNLVQIVVPVDGIVQMGGTLGIIG